MTLGLEVYTMLGVGLALCLAAAIACDDVGDGDDEE
jgi:hypothetical protein